LQVIGCLDELLETVSRLNRKGLFPYNAQALERLLSGALAIQRATHGSARV